MAMIRSGAIVIARARSGDDRAVRDLFAALHAFNAALEPRFALAEGWEAVLADHLAHERAAGHGLTLLAWDGDKPVGLLMMDGHTDSPLFRHRHWAELLSLYVVPEARGRAVGDRLLRSGLTWARSVGYDRVQLYVTACNHRARAFYGKAGFRPLQEVWLADLTPTSRPTEPPGDPDCEAAYAHGHYLLSATAHQVGGQDEPCEGTNGPDRPRFDSPSR